MKVPDKEDRQLQLTTIYDLINNLDDPKYWRRLWNVTGGHYEEPKAEWKDFCPSIDGSLRCYNCPLRVLGEHYQVNYLCRHSGSNKPDPANGEVLRRLLEFLAYSQL